MTGRFRGPRAGHRQRVGRVKLVYWVLIAVLGALVVFLLSAAARLLRGQGADATAADPGA